MTRSANVEAKARRYLAEGRLVVTHVDAETVEALCRGAGAIYRLGWRGRWECSCPARSDRCAHLVALRLVATAQPGHLTVAEPADGRTGSNAAEDGQTHPALPAETPSTPDPQSGARGTGGTR